MCMNTDRAFASAYYHWFHLIQPAPLPEAMIALAGLSYLHAKLGGRRGLRSIERQAGHFVPEELPGPDRGAAQIIVRALTRRGERVIYCAMKSPASKSLGLWWWPRP